MSGHKKFDTIEPPKVKVGKQQYTQEVHDESKPLLSILEPDSSSSKVQKKSPKSQKAKKKTQVATEPIFKEKKSWFRPKGAVAATSAAEEQAKKRFLKGHHKVIIVVASVLVFLSTTAILLAGGAYAHQSIYKSKMFPGVVVWGEDVGGLTIKEVQQLVTDKAENYKLTIKGPDQEYLAKVSDLGVSINSDSMASAAYLQGRSDDFWANYYIRARLILGKINWKEFREIIRAEEAEVAASYTVNQDRLSAYLGKLAENINIAPQDSEVIVSGSTTQLKPAIYGREVSLEKLKKQVMASIDKLKSEEIATDIRTLEPAIIDTSASEVMVQAQNVMQRPVVLSYKGVEYRPNQETVASWITFTKKQGETKYTLVVDQAKMASYFSFIGSKINIYSIPRLVRVENGVKQTETQAGTNGLLVDTALLGRQISEALPVQPKVTLQIPTYVDNFKTKYEQVIIADWDKYIDVNLSTQTMTACERGGVNCHQWRVMTGKDSTPTPVGTWLVQGRSANFWMTGLEGTPEYYRLWVPYSTWFKGGGYAIHSASWRNNDPNSANGFGNQAYHWNGSHGCVNAPDDAAVYIYNWASVGTPVIVHN